jgi:hypothetical protein
LTSSNTEVITLAHALLSAFPSHWQQPIGHTSRLNKGFAAVSPREAMARGRAAAAEPLLPDGLLERPLSLCALDNGASSRAELAATRRRLAAALAVAAAFTALEFGGGYLARSLVLMSDAAHAERRRRLCGRAARRARWRAAELGRVLIRLRARRGPRGARLGRERVGRHRGPVL